MASNKRLNILVDVKGSKKSQKQLGGIERSIGKMAKTAMKVSGILMALKVAYEGVSKVAQMAVEAGKFESLNKAFINLGKSANFNAKSFDKLKDATDGTIDSASLMVEANNALLLGIVKNDDEMAELFDTAQRLAKAVGKDATFGVQSLVTGLGRQSKLMLDNLGIIVDTNKAYEDYANKINKAVEKLTDEERKTAFLTAGMEQARSKAESLGAEHLDTSDKIKQMGTAMKDAGLAMGKLFAPIVDSVAEKLTMSAVSAGKFLTELNNIVEFGNAGGIEGLKKESDRTTEGYQKLTRGLSELRGVAIKAGFDIKEMNKAALYKDDGSLKTTREQAQAFKDLLDKKLEEVKVDKLKKEELKSFNEELFKNLELTKQASFLREKESEGLLEYLPTFGQYVAKKREEAQAQNLSNAYQQQLIEKYPALAKQLGIIGEVKKKNLSVSKEDLKMAFLSQQSASEAMKAIVRAETMEAVSGYVSSLFKTLPFPIAIGLSTGAGALVSALMDKALSVVPKFHAGGMIGGQGETPIMAQSGEFVMKREAVQSIGANNLDAMNSGQSPITINIQGGVVDEDYVRNQLVPAINRSGVSVA